MFLTVCFSLHSFKGLCLCYIHTQDLGFCNWFPPVSGWFEQPWLVSHTPISITSLQLTAGSLDRASHQPSEQLPGKGQYFWATDGYACHGCYSLGSCYCTTDTCSDLRALWASFLGVLKSLLCYQLPNECCVFNCQYRYPSFCGEWKYSAAEEKSFY